MRKGKTVTRALLVNFFVVFSIAVLFVLKSSVVYSSQPVAPPASQKNDQVPSKEEVGVPVPAKTYFLQTVSAKSNDQDEVHYYLVSEASLQALTEYYHDKLSEMPGWSWSEGFSFENQLSTFYKSDEELTLFNNRVPQITIRPFDSSMQQMAIDSNLRKKINSLLVISYY